MSREFPAQTDCPHPHTNFVTAILIRVALYSSILFNYTDSPKKKKSCFDALIRNARKICLPRDFRGTWSSPLRPDPCSTIQIRVYSVTDSVEFMSLAGEARLSALESKVRKEIRFVPSKRVEQRVEYFLRDFSTSRPWERDYSRGHLVFIRNTYRLANAWHSLLQIFILHIVRSTL